MRNHFTSWRIALLVALASAAPSGAGEFGIAMLGSDGSVCLAVEDGVLELGDRVTVVSPRQGEGSAYATVAGSAESCAFQVPAGVPGRAYRLGIESGHVPEGDPLVTILAEARVLESQEGVVVSMGETVLRLGVCTSMEGLHVNVWRRDGDRDTKVWHRYFHLQYEVEQTCSDAEVQPPAA